MYSLDGLDRIFLGYGGENNARVIEIDVSPVVNEYPGASIGIAVRRQGESVPYMARTFLSGGVLRWPITISETGVCGDHEFEVRAVEDGMLCKRKRAVGHVEESLTGETAQAPEAAGSWADALSAGLAKADRLTNVTAQARQGDAAGVEVTQTSDATCFTFTLPKGEAGPRGEAGPAGPKGDPGTTQWTGIDGKPLLYPPERHTHTAEEIRELSDLSARISNLMRAGRDVLYGFTADDAPAYVRTVPAAAVPFVAVDRVGGALDMSGEEPRPVRVTGIVSRDGDGNVVDTWVVPREVRDIAGYGYAAGELYNSVEHDGGWYFVKRVDRVDMGTLNWVYDTSSGEHPIFRANMGSFAAASRERTQARYAAYTDYATLTRIADNIPDRSIALGRTEARAVVRDDRYMSAADFRASVAGAMLYYERAEPERIAISELIGKMYIKACPGGTLTYVNADETEFAVPGRVTYQLLP